jgi:hypothetical protein
MDILEIILTCVYILLGSYVFVRSVKCFRKEVWIGGKDLCSLFLCFGVLWPIALVTVGVHKIIESDLLYKFLKFVNGK